MHSAAPRAECVLIELTNDDVGTYGPAAAFLRGAARQFNTSWGIDLFLWWCVINGCVQNLPASLHRRVMALGYVAGASVVSVEDCGWIDGETGRPNFMAIEVDRFGRLASGASGLPASVRRLPDATVQGAALVIPPDLGWSERPTS